jgi:hypothetical protein
MGVAVADKAATLGGFVDGGLEDPEVLGWTAEPQDGLGMNAGAMVLLGDSQQVGVRHVGLAAMGAVSSKHRRREVFCTDSFLVHSSILPACLLASIVSIQQDRVKLFFEESFW